MGRYFLYKLFLIGRNASIESTSVRHALFVTSNVLVCVVLPEDHWLSLWSISIKEIPLYQIAVADDWRLIFCYLRLRFRLLLVSDALS